MFVWDLYATKHTPQLSRLNLLHVPPEAASLKIRQEELLIDIGNMDNWIHTATSRSFSQKRFFFLGWEGHRSAVGATKTPFGVGGGRIKRHPGLLVIM